MNVMRWLLDSDPAIRWQTMRDLTDESDERVAAERSRIASEGWGAALLAFQAPDGHFVVGGKRGWSTDLHALVYCSKTWGSTRPPRKRAVPSNACASI